MPDIAAAKPGFNLRLYESRNCLRPQVPRPKVTMKSKVQIQVMMRPVGKMPRVTPGSTNGVGEATVSDVLAARLEKKPSTNEASLFDRTTLMFCPEVV